MEQITKKIFNNLYRPPRTSHKGQNGKLTIIGGSKLFHGASLWALKTASRIVDMVFYATVKENKQLTKTLKSKFYDFICVPRGKVEEYIEQSDTVLIGPGMVRGNNQFTGTGESGQQTKKLTKKLLDKFPNKKWIIDAGALQEMDVEWLKSLDKVIVTPHKKEFEKLFGVNLLEYRKQNTEDRLTKAKERKQTEMGNLSSNNQFSKISHQSSVISHQAKKFGCTIVLKGKTDIVCSPEKCVLNTTGNEGMTKGGTGDVLAGLIAALACKNDLFLAAQAGVYINGKAGDKLYKKVGPCFNASDLCNQIPKTMKKLIGY